MLKNIETLNKMKQYVSANDVADTYKIDALSTINRIVKAESAKDCKIALGDTESICKMPAIVGFDEVGNAVYWDMAKGSLLATAQTGVAMNYMGFSTAVVSAILNYSVDEFRYYLATDELAPKFLREDEHCIAYTSVFKKHQTSFDEILTALDNEVKKREALSQDELSREPFLLVVFGNLCHFDVDYKKNEALFKRIIENGADLKIACFVATSRLELETIHDTCDFAHMIITPIIPRGRYLFVPSLDVMLTHHNELGIALSSQDD